MRTRFDKQLAHLNDSLVEMGGLVEQAIAGANRALTGRDEALAKSVISMDDEIDNKEKEIEGLPAHHHAAAACGGRFALGVLGA